VSVETQKPGWKTFRNGNLLEAGTSQNFKTGSWATEIPVWDAEKCIHCMICWIVCPDDCWEAKDGKIQGVNLDFCKGCGICANECLAKPNKAITMSPKVKA